MSKPWTIYPARPLSNLPGDLEEALNREFVMLKTALRKENFKLYEFVGLDPKAVPETVTDFDLSCVELADLLLAIRPCASDGVSGEVAWKCHRKEHVIMALPHDCKVSRFSLGWKARNPNFEIVRYAHLLDLVPLVKKHFALRSDLPKICAAPLVEFKDSATGQPLFRPKQMPVAR